MSSASSSKSGENQLNIEGERDQVCARSRRNGRHLGTIHRSIQRVALYRHSPGGADEPLEFGPRGKLRSFRSSIMINFLFHYSAIQIVGAETQSDLRDARRKHDPIRFDVVEIIEQQPPDSNVTQVRVARRFGNIRKRRIIWMERERNESHKPMRLV